MMSALLGENITFLVVSLHPHAQGDRAKEDGEISSEIESIADVIVRTIKWQVRPLRKVIS